MMNNRNVIAYQHGVPVREVGLYGPTNLAPQEICLRASIQIYRANYFTPVSFKKLAILGQQANLRLLKVDQPTLSVDDGFPHFSSTKTTRPRQTIFGFAVTSFV
jgi:hypothetical protein